MYENHFGFRCLPFEDRADAQFFFATPEREETLAAMEYEAHFGLGILVVQADAGMGKTLLVRTLACRLDAGDRPVILQWQAGTERSLIRECCKGFGVSIPSSGGDDRAVARLSRHLTRTRKSGHQSVLVVDQAENLSSANLVELSLLAEIEDGKGRLLPIILVGQSGLVALVQGSNDETLKQYVREVRQLRALDPSQCAAYIEHRLAVAGVAEGGLFTPDAMKAIHRASGGIPRLINRLGHSALVAAYGAGRARVESEMIVEVAGGRAAVERSAPVSEIGLRTTEQVAGGWGGMAGANSGEARPPVSVATQPSTTGMSYEKGEKPPANAYGGGAEQPTVFGDADEFYERLAQTVSRSERATASTEVALAKAGAVDQHLEGLLGRAEAVVAVLGGRVQEGEGFADHIKRRLDEIASETERRVEAMESRALRTGTVASDVEDQIQRIEEACVRAEGIERRLSDQAAQIADKADDVQQHVATISQAVSGSQEAQLSMERMIARASAITGSAEEKIAAIRGSLTSVIADAESESVKAQQRLASVRSKLAATVEKAQTVEQELGDRALERCQRKVEAKLDALEKERSVRLENLLEQYRRERDSLENAEQQRLASFSTEIDARLEQTIDGARDRVVGLIENLTGRIDQLKNSVDEVEKKETKVSAVSGEVGRAIRVAETTVNVLTDRVNDLQGKLGGASSVVDKLAETASTITDSLAESTSRGKTLVNQTREACGDLEVVFEKVGTALIQTGRACEQADAARIKAAECEKIVARFDNDTEKGRAIAERLETLVPTCQTAAEELANATCDATNTTERLVNHTHDASATAEQLQRGVEQGQEAIDRITAAAITAEQAVESVQSTSSNLQGRHESAAQLVSELDSLNATARRLHEALQGVVGHADEKTGKLSSQNAAASKVLKQLSDANIDIHGTLKRAVETQRKIEALTKDVWSLTTKSEGCVKVLTNKTEAAERITAKLSAATEKVQPLVSDLNSHVTKAVEVEQRIASKTTKAGEIVKRIDGITDLLKQANELNESVGKTVSDAKTVGAELTATMEQILPQYQQMQEVCATAQGMIETSTQLKSESEMTVERFIENLQASQQVIEEVESQAESLSHQMQKAEKDRNRIEQRIETLMVQPKKILEQAQSQSAQLERVCSAVRKVFANLSKTSLEAKERTGELRSVEQQATRRLEQLVAETNATTQVLNQWVQEAINAQTRLQIAVERVPSIEDTQTGDRLRRLSTSGKPVMRLANPSAEQVAPAAEPTELETATLIKTANEKKSNVISNEGKQPTSTRAAEIARMIDEAKKTQAVG